MRAGAWGGAAAIVVHGTLGQLSPAFAQPDAPDAVPSPPVPPSPPSPRAPQAPAPPAAAPPVVDIQFKANAPGLAFHMRIEDAATAHWHEPEGYNAEARGYAHVCAPPCDAMLRAGTYRLALSDGDRSPVEPVETVTIRGPSTVTGSYTSHHTMRIVGWTVAGVSVAVGAVLTLAGLSGGSTCTQVGQESNQYICGPKMDTGVVFGTAAGFGVAAVAGLVLALQQDSARITVTPLDVGRALSAPRGEGAGLVPPTGSAPGLGVAARW